MRVITKAHELAEHTIRICGNEKNFPKRYRWCLTAKIVDSAVNINSYLEKANSINVRTDYDYEIRRGYMQKALAECFSLHNLMGLSYDIFGLDGDNPSIGMGLGSQMTQLIQLAVLDDIDHYIKEVLRVKHYIRYMDDFILLHNDKSYLLYCKQEIERLLNLKGLKLSKRKTQVTKLKQPIKFLGFTYWIKPSGKVILRLNKNKVSHERRKLKRQLRRASNNSLMTYWRVRECYKSWLAHAKNGDSYYLIGKMNSYYKLQGGKS